MERVQFKRYNTSVKFVLGYDNYVNTDKQEPRILVMLFYADDGHRVGCLAKIPHEALKT